MVENIIPNKKHKKILLLHKIFLPLKHRIKQIKKGAKYKGLKIISFEIVLE